MKTNIFDIITVPHPQLRAAAAQVTKSDRQLRQFVESLEETLRHTNNPKGVGLAAPQVDRNLQAFSTYLEDEMLTFINPEIVSHSEEVALGENPEEPDLEGCLSIPKLYGPVPRWTWLELEYDKLVINQEKTEELHLSRTSRRFDGFHARVVQHEFDHLAGVLFIDYCLAYDLPVQMAENRRSKMTEMPREIFETLHHTTLAENVSRNLELHPTTLTKKTGT